MSPASKFNPEQEQRMVLQAAAQVIAQSTILDFKMSAIAATAGISMGSVYKHVQSKEDVMIALVSISLEHYLSTFKQILELPMSMPERCIATILSDISACGLHFFDEHLHMLVKNEAILRKGSARWRDRLLQIERQFESTFYKAFEDAFDEGELRGDNKFKVLDQLDLGLWALYVGFSQISLLNSGFRLYGRDQDRTGPYEMHSTQVQCTKAFINTFDWKKPLDQEGVQRAYQQLERLGFRKS